MDTALAVLFYVLGMASGGLIVFAMVADRLRPIETDERLPLDTIEQRSRSVQ